MLVLGAALGLFLYNLAPGARLDDRLDARLIGVVLAMSTWFEQPKGDDDARVAAASA